MEFYKIMNNYRLEEIHGNGYERWAMITDIKSNIRMVVHFQEYAEYLDDGEITCKRKKGDIVKGCLKIDLVTRYKILEDVESTFIQEIKESSNITAVAKVKEIEDSDILICNINNLGENISVEFEDDIDIEVGKVIEVNGSLELNNIR